MINTHPNRLTLRDIARILFRHWPKMLVLFCWVMALTWLVTAFYPRSYSSEAKLVIRVGRENVALDPTATTGQTIDLQKSQEDEVNLSIDVLSSRKVLERVVETIGARRILDKSSAGNSGSSNSDPSKSPGPTAAARVAAGIDSVLNGLRLSDAASDSDLAIRRLSSKERVSSAKQSSIITVSYSASSPELAHDVVAAISNVFLEEHLQLNQTEGSLEFFAEQADKLHQELVTKQAELRDRKTAFQLTAGNRHLSMLEKSTEALREKIYELETQESDLKSRYTDEYPPLKELRRQRAEAEATLVEFSAGATKMTGAVAGLDRSHVSDVKGGKLYAEVQTLNDQELQLAQLEHEVELLEGKYRMHVEKLEQARVNDAMGKERITNIKVAQPATLVAKATWPNTQVLLVLGAICAICTAIGGAFVAEAMDQTIKTHEQVESELGLPVLLSLPYRKRRKQVTARTTDDSRSVEPARAATLSGHASAGRYGALLRELRSVSGKGAGYGHCHARSVGVVGCDTSNVRSRVAAELAIRASRSGTDPVLLIDADSRHRRVARRFHLNGSPGWHDVLAGTASALSCIHRPKSDNLGVMTAGSSNGHSSEKGPTTDPQQQLENIKTDYGLIVVDLPPVRELEAHSATAEWFDEMVLVVEAEHTRMQSARLAKEMLERTGVRLKGVVLANEREHLPRWLHQRL